MKLTQINPSKKNTRSSLPEVFLRKSVLKICSEFTVEHPCQKCDFNKVALQLYWNRTSAWGFYCKFAAYFQNTVLPKHLWKAVSRTPMNGLQIKQRFYTNLISFKLASRAFYAVKTDDNVM